MEREMKRQQALLDKLMDPNLTDEERRALMAGEKDRRVKSKRKSGGGGGGGGGSGGSGGGGGKKGKGGKGSGGGDEDDDGGGGGGKGGRRRAGGSGGGGDGGAGAAPPMQDAKLGTLALRTALLRELAGKLDPSKPLPTSAATSLCEIKFNRKDVRAMNILMCRRLLLALYQVKIEAKAEADRKEHEHQPFLDLVPNQFVVLYGIKALAIKNINEFLYGRYRKDEKRGPSGKARAEGEEPLIEPEPLLMPFWRGAWHGVPFDERSKMSDFKFYLDMLAAVAKTVGDEHTLQLKSTGAFWNLLGLMTEIELPIFVLLNTCSRMFVKTLKDLFERLKRMVLQKATTSADSLGVAARGGSSGAREGCGAVAGTTTAVPGEEVPRSGGGGGACDGGSAAADAWTAEAHQALLLVCKGRCGKGSKLGRLLEDGGGIGAAVDVSAGGIQYASGGTFPTSIELPGGSTSTLSVATL
eukprot:jgi/Chrpa1/18861/Chrysochromulina_OHIO_Genome00021547-RA